REATFLQRAVEAWRDEPNIEILGNLEAERLSIVSFTVRTQEGRHLHHNAVVALLNDLFGIQARGGCSCAGPYGHALLGIDLEQSREFEREIGRGCEGIKPGWVRVNFNYFISDVVADYVIEAVRLVARDGWRLLGDYEFDAKTGRWRHHDGPPEPPLRLHQVRFEHGQLTYPRQQARAGEDVLAQQLDEGRRILASAATTRLDQGSVNADFDHLRWFDLPASSLPVGLRR
ncbi:MAG: aminotransferase, partial [Humibacillus sp.]